MIRVLINDKLLGGLALRQLADRFPMMSFVIDETEGKNAEIAVVLPSYFQRHPIANHPRLRFVQLLMVGYDKFDTDRATRQGIAVSNAQAVFSTTIAEDILTKIFVLNRHVKHYFAAMERRTWEPIPGEKELTGSTVGILGTGSIGKELAKKLQGFDLRVIGYRRSLEAVQGFSMIYHGEAGLEIVIRESDVLVIALPNTPETKHLMNSKRFMWMKKDAILINVGRGEVIDQAALIHAIKSGQIRGAGLDVTTPEPLPPDNELWQLPNVYITPHNAVSSPHLSRRLTQLIEENLEHYLKQEPLLNQIN